MKSLSDEEVVGEFIKMHQETGNIDGDAHDELIDRGIAVTIEEEGYHWYYRGEEQ